ncbi:MAG TPA: hypothetical protein PKK72_01470 [Chitinophagales bacterium]|nr:hypothetical protein [Chitinophagales bacterium]
MLHKLHIRRLFHITLLLVVIAGISSCGTTQFRKDYYNVNTLLHDSTQFATGTPWLKAHMKNGNIVIFYNTWEVDSAQTYISGFGAQYDFNRQLITQDHLSIPIDDIALFETNNPVQDNKGRISAITIMTGLDILFGVVCITVPKACWGSCPTFYIDSTATTHYADAEGFSNAILPSMQYGDIDALPGSVLPGSTFRITLRNEALETHCIDKVTLYAISTPTNKTAFQSVDNKFYLGDKNFICSKANDENGEITALLEKADTQERFSTTDAHNLKSKEAIYLNFPSAQANDSIGLLLRFRQTLLPTYCYYNAVSYMGDFVGGINTLLETDEKIRNKFGHDGFLGALGGIDVHVWNESENDWKYEGAFNETGPIAINTQILPLSASDGKDSIKIKLVLNKGLWRIDQAALVTDLHRTQAEAISPHVINAAGGHEDAFSDYLSDSTNYLITYPGEHFYLDFPMPEQSDHYTAFLYSEGYYLEWMRGDWLADKNILKLRYMLNFPNLYLKTEASVFKEHEAAMEQIFWNSRISQPIFSSNE